MIAMRKRWFPYVDRTVQFIRRLIGASNIDVVFLENIDAFQDVLQGSERTGRLEQENRILRSAVRLERPKGQLQR